MGTQSCVATFCCIDKPKVQKSKIRKKKKKSRKKERKGGKPKTKLFFLFDCTNEQENKQVPRFISLKPYTYTIYQLNTYVGRERRYKVKDSQ